MGTQPVLARVEAVEPESEPGSEAEPRVLQWLALGDSYSAGEGLPHVSDTSAYDRVCQRARADDDFESRSWAPAAAETVTRHRGVSAVQLDFVACTGATTDDVFSFGEHPFADGQLAEALAARGAERAGDVRWDVVSFSMGGNNLAFSDVIFDCVGADRDGLLTAVAGGAVGWGVAPFVGCSFSEDEIKDRIDRLTDPASVSEFTCQDPSGLQDADGRGESGGDVGVVTLPEFYDYLADCVVADGGTILIMGYPQIVEQSGMWNDYNRVADRCQRIRRADHGMLRGIAAHLNHQILRAIDDARERNPTVRFEFIDPNHFFEGGVTDGSEPSDSQRNSPVNRHALCGAGEDYLNGITIGTAGDGVARFMRSFHPNQLGYTAMGSATAARVEQLLDAGRFDYITPGDRESRPQPGVDSGANTAAVMLVVDISGSMSEVDEAGRVKIEAAKESLLNFLGGAEQDIAIGMRTFPNQSGADCAPGDLRFNVQPRDPEEMSALIRQLRPDGDTPTAEALLAAADDLRRAGYEHATLVLVSDGESTCDPPCDAAQQIAESGIDLEIISVGFQISAQGRAELDCVAQATRGRYIDVDDADELEEVVDGLTRPELTLTVSHPEEVVPTSGLSTEGTVRVSATVVNEADIIAENVITRFAFTDIPADLSPGVIGPVRSLGNLEPGVSREVTWTFRPGLGLAGASLPFEVTAGADNGLADQRAQSSIRVKETLLADEVGDVIASSNIAILGDSYSAGEGAEDYFEGTDTDDNSCHRSRQTYLLGFLEIPDRNLLACSGAVMHDLLYPSGGQSSQIAQLIAVQESAGPVDAVVLTIGGNDIGFSTIGKSCLLSPIPCDDRIGTQPTQDFLAERLTAQGDDSFVQRLRLTLGAIDSATNNRRLLEERGEAAPIVVLAYPRIVPSYDRSCGELSPVLNQGEIEFVNEVITALNGHVEAAAVVAQQDGLPVLFVERTENAFLPDRTVCDRDSYVRGPASINISTPDLSIDLGSLLRGRSPVDVVEILRGSGARSTQELLHPNANGYQATTESIARWSASQDASAILRASEDRELPPYAAPELSDTPPVEIKIGIGESIVVQNGRSYRVTGGGFAPGLPVEIVVRSAPRVLGVVSADLDGNVDAEFVLPVDLSAGAHTLELTGLDTGLEPTVIQRAVTVQAAEESTNLVVIAAAGAVLVALVGLGFLSVARRRRQRLETGG